MTGEVNQTSGTQAGGEQAAEQPARERTIADRTTPPTETTASDNWKISNEEFRRLAHTGEFSPEQKSTDTKE
jgi:hypothetical protein